MTRDWLCIDPRCARYAPLECRNLESLHRENCGSLVIGSVLVSRYAIPLHGFASSVNVKTFKYQTIYGYQLKTFRYSVRCYQVVIAHSLQSPSPCQIIVKKKSFYFTYLFVKIKRSKIPFFLLVSLKCSSTIYSFYITF